MANEQKQSTVKKATLNPTWNETFTFPVTHIQSQLLRVYVRDKDFIKYDDLGEVTIFLNSLPVGKKFDKTYDLDEAEHGKIHLQLLLQTSSSSKTLDVQKPKKLMRYKSLTYGLSELKKVKYYIPEHMFFSKKAVDIKNGSGKTVCSFRPADFTFTDKDGGVLLSIVENVRPFQKGKKVQNQLHETIGKLRKRTKSFLRKSFDDSSDVYQLQIKPHVINVTDDTFSNIFKSLIQVKGDYVEYEYAMQYLEKSELNKKNNIVKDSEIESDDTKDVAKKLAEIKFKSENMEDSKEGDGVKVSAHSSSSSLSSVDSVSSSSSQSDLPLCRVSRRKSRYDGHYLMEIRADWKDHYMFMAVAAILDRLEVGTAPSEKNEYMKTKKSQIQTAY